MKARARNAICFGAAVAWGSFCALAFGTTAVSGAFAFVGGGLIAPIESLWRRIWSSLRRRPGDDLGLWLLPAAMLIAGSALLAAAVADRIR